MRLLAQIRRGISLRAFALLVLGCTIAFVPQSVSAEGLDAGMCRKVRPAAYDQVPGMTNRPLKIVAIGSSSTEGIERNAKSKLYPAAMQSALKRLWPTAEISVLNKGRGGETMADTLKRFEDDVLTLKPSLVIWQLGVNDVLRYQGLEGRREEIQAGIKILTDQGIPVILLDLQYAPVVLKDPDTLPMQTLIDAAVKSGPQGRVFHFKRFAVMKELAEKFQIPADDMTDGDGLHMTDAMHDCVGLLLAEMIVSHGPLTVSARP